MQARRAAQEESFSLAQTGRRSQRRVEASLQPVNEKISPAPSGNNQN